MNVLHVLPIGASVLPIGASDPSPRLVAVAIVSCLMFGISLPANDELRREGERLFEKEWIYEEPPMELTAAIFELPEVVVLRRRAAQPTNTNSIRGDGLGPMHNATSCAACHERGGGAGVDRNVTLLTIDPRNSFFQPLPVDSKRDAEQATHAAKKALTELFPTLVLSNGNVSVDMVIHDKSTRPFYQQIRNDLTKHVPFGIKDEWFRGDQRNSTAIANQPVIAGRHGEIDFYLSQRNSPPLYGLGLINSVSRTKLLRLVNVQKNNRGDGVVGRLGAGKFGWRAQTPSLQQFIRNACAGELGLQTRLASQTADVADDSYRSPGIDMSEGEVAALTRYVWSLPPPKQVIGPEQNPVDVREGERLFVAIGCATCHVKNLDAAKGVYSDLLLHDLGELLQAPSPAPLEPTLVGVPLMRPVLFPAASQSANRSRASGRFLSSGIGYYGIPSDTIPMPYPFTRASEPFFPRGRLPERFLKTTNPKEFSWDRLQREWRTPPLWGVADSAPYLHDGRSETLDSAIRWHAGEASQATEKYRALTPEKREQIILFLSTLRAPESMKSKIDIFQTDEAGLTTLAVKSSRD